MPVPKVSYLPFPLHARSVRTEQKQDQLKRIEISTNDPLPSSPKYEKESYEFSGQASLVVTDLNTVIFTPLLMTTRECEIGPNRQFSTTCGRM